MVFALAVIIVMRFVAIALPQRWLAGRLQAQTTGLAVPLALALAEEAPMEESGIYGVFLDPVDDKVLNLTGLQVRNQDC